jgi:hypothetical protein
MSYDWMLQKPGGLVVPAMNAAPWRFLPCRSCCKEESSSEVSDGESSEPPDGPCVWCNDAVVWVIITIQGVETGPLYDPEVGASCDPVNGTWIGAYCGNTEQFVGPPYPCGAPFGSYSAFRAIIDEGHDYIDGVPVKYIEFNVGMACNASEWSWYYQPGWKLHIRADEIDCRNFTVSLPPVIEGRSQLYCVWGSSTCTVTGGMR